MKILKLKMAGHPEGSGERSCFDLIPETPEEMELVEELFANISNGGRRIRLLRTKATDHQASIPFLSVSWPGYPH